MNLNDGDASSAYDSQHDYEFIIEGHPGPVVRKVMNLRSVIKIQSLVRGWITRMRTR